MFNPFKRSIISNKHYPHSPYYGVGGLIEDYIFFASLASSIDADYAKGDPTGTFSRVSGAWRKVPSTGYYEAVRGDRENLALYSEQFDNSWWGKINCSVSADADGNADGIIANTSNVSHYVYHSFGGLKEGSVVIFSIKAKKGDKDWFWIQSNEAWETVYFNLSNGTVGTVYNSPVDYGIEDVGNGYYRVWMAVLMTLEGITIGFGPAETDTPINFVGDGTTINCYVLGAQFEVVEGPSSPPGPELISNGDFATDPDTSWTWNAPWTHDTTNYEADIDGTQTGSVDLEQTVAIRQDHYYQVQFTVKNYIAGTLTPRLGGTAGSAVSANGTYTQYIKAGSGTLLELRADVDFQGSVDDVFVKEITLPGPIEPGPYTQTTTSIATIPAEARFEDTDGDNQGDAVLLEPESINYCLWSRDLTNAVWQKNVTVSQDQVGIDGVSNKAWMVSDDSTTSTKYIQQNISVTADTEYRCAFVFIKKDSNSTVYPLFGFWYSGQGLSGLVTINTSTGECQARSDAVPDFYGVIDKGDWWLVYVVLQNNGSGTNAVLYLSPAWSDTMGATSSDVTLTRSMVVDQFQFEQSIKFPTSPIPTEDSPVVRTSEDDGIYWSKTSNVASDTGTIYLEVRIPAEGQWQTGNAVFFTSDTASKWLYMDETGALLSHDGTGLICNLANTVTEGWHKVALRFNSSTSKGQGFWDGTGSTEASYDGAMKEDANYIYVGKGLSAKVPVYIRNLKIWDKDKGSSWCQSATS